LASDIPAGDDKMANLFLQCNIAVKYLLSYLELMLAIRR